MWMVVHDIGDLNVPHVVWDNEMSQLLIGKTKNQHCDFKYFKYINQSLSKCVVIQQMTIFIMDEKWMMNEWLFIYEHELSYMCEVKFCKCCVSKSYWLSSLKWCIKWIMRFELNFVILASLCAFWKLDF
jgi:hypothetical protein